MIHSKIKDRALALGFDLDRGSPIRDSPELAFFDRWLEEGYAGEMHYFAQPARRRDLRYVLPDAQSVVVCGLNYDTDYPYSTMHRMTYPPGWIARCLE